MTEPGTLFGVGVGPGDPDLITLKAVKALGQVDVIFAAASTDNDHSIALSIAGPHLPGGARVVTLGFPMTHKRAALEQAWEDNAAIVAETVEAGENAAFLTLGDPLTYSTFGYLLRALRRRSPDLPVVVIPGVTSYQAAAARTETVLSEARESLLVISGICDAERLRALLKNTDNAAILKAYRNLPVIRQTLEEMNLTKNVTFVSRLGLEDEMIVEDADAIPDDPNYLSLLLVKK
jgi:precorrin-2/cobalt-factor-2 C20-methyltransferase